MPDLRGFPEIGEPVLNGETEVGKIGHVHGQEKDGKWKVALDNGDDALITTSPELSNPDDGEPKPTGKYLPFQVA